MYREFTDQRDPAGPVVRPVYRQGRIVRFSNDPERDIPGDGACSGSGVLYVMNPSDPNTWWTPRLARHEPD